MRSLTKVLCAVAVTAASASVHAFIDPPVVSPEDPTDTTPITISLRYGGCNALLDHEVQVTGSIAVTITKQTHEPPDCHVPESEYEIPVGLLPPGTYWYRTYLRDQEPPDAPAQIFHADRLTVAGSVAYVSDLEVELIATPSTFMPPGTEGRLTARFTNHGPDATDSISGRTPLGVQFGEHIPYDLYLGPFTECDIRFTTFSPPPEGPLTAVMIYNFDEPMAAGETRECVIGFDAKPTASGTFTFQVEFRHLPPLNYTDPNPGNNIAELNVVFGDPPPAAAMPVPTLRRLGIVLLVVGVLLLSFLQGRHV